MIRHAPSIGLGLGLSLRGSGGSGGVGFRGLLDQYGGASAAYSLRALSSGWLAGDVVEVRRSSDSTTQDFTASQIDGGAMLDFVNNSTWTSAVNSPTSPYTTFTGTSLSGFSATLSSGVAFGGFGGVSGVSGQTVSVSFDVVINSGSPNLALRTSSTVINTKSNSVAITTSGSYTADLTANAAFGFIGFSEGDAGSDYTISNFEVTAVSGGDGFVSTWYDQSGNGNNATQTTTTAQPKIVDAGSLIEDANGNPWIDFQNAAGGSIGLDLDSNIRETNGASSIFASIKFDEIFTGGTEYQNPIFLYDTQRWLVGSTTGPVGYRDIAISDAGGVTADARYVRFPPTLTNHNLLSSIYDGSSTTGGGKPDIQFDENAVAQVGTDGSIDFGVPTTGNNSIGYRMDTSNQGCNAKFQEVIIYASDQSANRAAIETNINDHYGIY